MLLGLFRSHNFLLLYLRKEQAFLENRTSPREAKIQDGSKSAIDIICFVLSDNSNCMTVIPGSADNVYYVIELLGTVWCVLKSRDCVPPPKTAGAHPGNFSMFRPFGQDIQRHAGLRPTGTW